MSATIKDIARKTGVAASTVSRVLTNKGSGYSSATAEKVRIAAKELGYKKNQAAVELVKQRSNVIATVVSSVKTSFAGQIIDGIQTEATKHGLNLIIIYSNSADPVEQKRALLTAIERPVRGILLLSIALSPDNLALLQESQIPFCFLSIGFNDKRFPFISSDDREIGYQATKLLLAKGHRQIGLAAIDKYPYTGRLRLEGYRKALKEANVTPKKEWVQLGDYSYAAGQTAMRAYGTKTKLTAVIAGSDESAVGVLNQARNLGLKVPEDLSIVSIDGTEICEMVQPQLTSVSQEFYKMGIEGVERLEETIAGTNAESQKQVYTPISIVERESVKDVSKRAD
ncbi:LacI family transcriptional regulator [Lacticaseibacillus casei]|uniref:LacI family DNA-binding transcriptional regulator n=1 Tax=Lacticaseibacillus TaxID=2759736 RepID=UPI00063D88E8|nr:MULTISPECIES: LacI family DNA-binding transcriptional regulator [Lacticaseibacillus]KLI74642.1 LacI family transcriptional regulator [Lacticaseibacillus casei]OLS06292.1 LacI family transcriptional regulator [Lacticaseibacillus casei]QVI32413.1 LacI family DNA-binding transcriptional regulator [Lacticaseibacillus zeae]